MSTEIRPLRSLGIIGWDEIELTILSALVSGLPILFVGGHGAAKTEGAEAIARAIMPDLKWAVYECPNIQTDDLVGFPNPHTLDAGVVSFVGTSMSVWNVNAIVLDELTRTTSSTVAKLMELVRTRKVYGIPTTIERVFATANPPSREDSASKLNIPTVSRFVVVHVPSFSELSDEDAETVLSTSLGGTWDWWPVKPQPVAVSTVLEIRALLAGHGIYLSGRSTRYIHSLLGSAKAFKSLCTPEALTTLVCACIPEFSRVATVTVDSLEAKMSLISFFEQHTQDGLPDVNDWPSYMAALISKIRSCASVATSESLVAEIPTLRSVVDDHPEDIQSLMAEMIPKVLSFTKGPPQTMASFLYSVM